MSSCCEHSCPSYCSAGLHCDRIYPFDQPRLFLGTDNMLTALLPCFFSPISQSHEASIKNAGDVTHLAITEGYMAGASLSYLLLLSMIVLNGRYCCLSSCYFGILIPAIHTMRNYLSQIPLCFTDYISSQMNLPEYIKEHTPNKHKKKNKQTRSKKNRPRCKLVINFYHHLLVKSCVSHGGVWDGSIISAL